MSADVPAEVLDLARLLEVVRELRRRCPWDREQTVASLAGFLVEEAYETVDAIERGNDRDFAEELGDLLALALSVGTIAQEEGRADLGQMVAHASEKLVRRHPHVYGGARMESVDEVVAGYSAIKRAERRAAGHDSALGGIAAALPALSYAQKLGERARLAGMDWADAAAVLAKVREELDETERALRESSTEQALEEVGDLMLAIANLPRFFGRDAEQTLRRASHKFIARFERVEHLCRARGLELESLTPEEVDRLWKEAKRTTSAT